jgi:hypothetical protein
VFGIERHHHLPELGFRLQDRSQLARDAAWTAGPREPGRAGVRDGGRGGRRHQGHGVR